VHLSSSLGCVSRPQIQGRTTVERGLHWGHFPPPLGLEGVGVRWGRVSPQIVRDPGRKSPLRSGVSVGAVFVCSLPVVILSLCLTFAFDLVPVLIHYQPPCQVAPPPPEGLCVRSFAFAGWEMHRKVRFPASTCNCHLGSASLG